MGPLPQQHIAHDSGEMLLRTLRRHQQQQQQQRSSTSSRVKAPSPHEILGVHPGASLDVVKRRYRELARLHHPDMPTGSQHRFREITAAYHIIRTQAALNHSRADGAQAADEHAKKRPTFSRPSGGAQREESSASSSSSTAADGTQTAAPRYAPSPFVMEYLWYSDGFEWLATFFGCLALGMWTVDAFYFQGAVGTSRARLHRQDIHHYSDSFNPTPPLLEAGLEENSFARGASGMYAPATPLSVTLLRKNLRAAASSRRYTDIRDFLLDNEPSNDVVPRRVTVTRFTADLVDESSIPQKCVHVRSFDSNVVVPSSSSTTFPSSSSSVAAATADPYASTVLELLADAVEATTYAVDDAKTASLLAMYAMQSVPRVSPQSAKWVVVDYRPASAGRQRGARGSEGAGGSAATECLFAVQNLKFQSTPSTVAQVVRMVVYGNTSEEDEQQRVPSQRGGARGGIIKMRDVPSFPNDFYRPKV